MSIGLRWARRATAIRMKHGDEQAKEPLRQPGQRRPDQSQAWVQLTYDYLQSLLEQLDDVMGLFRAQDRAGIRYMAHRAKGTSGTYGLRPIAEKFAQLEGAAGTHLREDIPGLVVTIRQLIEAESERLRPWVAPSGRDQNGDTNG